MGERIRVFIADDHPVYVDGLSRFFESDDELEVVGSAADGETALREIRELRPDVAILDVVMPGKTGLEIVQALTAEPKIQTILLTGSDERGVIYRAVAAGAGGYLLKSADWDDLVDATKRVADGEVVIAPEVTTILASQIRDHAEGHPGIELTKREQEVLGLARYSINEIANRLRLQPNTVKVHLRHIYRKLRVANKTAALAEAMKRGLLR